MTNNDLIHRYVIHAVHHHVSDEEMYKSGEVWIAHMAQKAWDPKRSADLDWTEYDACQAEYQHWYLKDTQIINNNNNNGATN